MPKVKLENMAMERVNRLQGRSLLMISITGLPLAIDLPKSPLSLQGRTGKERNAAG